MKVSERHHHEAYYRPGAPLLDCFWCGRALNTFTQHGKVPKPLDATVDHVLPKNMGGANNRQNRVRSCFECNEKRNRIHMARTAREKRSMLRRYKDWHKGQGQQLRAGFEDHILTTFPNGEKNATV